MVNTVIRATTHVATWLIWHTLRISLLDDLETSAPPSRRERAA